MDPRSAVGVVHGLSPEESPEEFQARLEEMSRGTTAYDAARVFGIHEVIDPRETRSFIEYGLDVTLDGIGGGVGSHHLSSWPTSL